MTQPTIRQRVEATAAVITAGCYALRAVTEEHQQMGTRASAAAEMIATWLADDVVFMALVVEDLADLQAVVECLSRFQALIYLRDLNKAEKVLGLPLTPLPTGTAKVTA